MSATAERDHTQDARLLARRFHEHHEKWFSESKGREPTPWDDMPASYHRRVTFTFEAMLRGGVITVGPIVGFDQARDSELGNFTD